VSVAPTPAAAVGVAPTATSHAKTTMPVSPHRFTPRTTAKGQAATSSLGPTPGALDPLDEAIRKAVASP
jgi:hypothetical protein